MRRTWRLVCPVLAGVNVLSAGLIADRVVRHSWFPGQRGAGSLLLGCMGALAIYCAIVVAVGRWRGALESRELRIAIYAGVGAAVWMCLQLLMERFAMLSPRWNGPAVLASMLVMFSAWGCVASIARRAGLSLVASLGLAAWSAVVTMSLGVCFGVLLELYLAPVAPESIRLWPEFQRSGWSDAGAFAVGNTMASAISHMIFGPVAAVLFGLVGVLFASATGARLQNLIAGR